MAADDIQNVPTTGEADIPTLPEAIQLFQLESMNKLRQTIQIQEGVITEQQTRMEALEEALADKSREILRCETDHTSEVRRLSSTCETEKTSLKEEFAEENEEKTRQCDAEMAQCEAAKALLTEVFTGEKEEEKERCDAGMAQCEAEKTQLEEEFQNQILEKETKCEEARMEIESKTTQESERLETKLQQCEITTVYMGNVMLQNNQGMLEGQRLLESQANAINEANEEIKRQREGLLICEAATNSTVLQAETITLLRSSIDSTLNLPRLSTSDLEQLDVAPFMLEMVEAYNKQTKTIEDLNAVVEKGNTVEERMFELAEGLANLTSILESATVNLNIVDQQAHVIQNQAKSIAQLTPLLRHTSKDVVWYEKAGAGGAEVGSNSSCSCLPRSADSSRPIPARIEYHCGDLSNR